MHAQFLFTAVGFGVAVIMATLTMTGILPGPTAVIDDWSVTRPTVPRRWLAVAFWINLMLPVAACGVFLGTTGQALPAAWNDVAQLLLWVSMAVDAAVAQRRLWLVVTIVFLVFSAYEVATHL